MPFQITVGFDEKPEQPLDLVAYLFDRDGKLLETAPLREGKGAFKAEAARAARGRLAVLPAPTDDRPAPKTLAEARKLDAYEPVTRIDPKARLVEPLPIPADIWRRWFLCACRVRGRVVKRVEVQGNAVDWPVCHARVHILEVDRLWLLFEKLPDLQVDRFRRELIREFRKPRVWPPPPPPPPDPIPWEEIQAGPTPWPVPPRMFDLPDTVMINPQPEPPGRGANLSIAGLEARRAFTQLGPQPEPPDMPAFEAQPFSGGSPVFDTINAPLRLSNELMAALEGPSVFAARQALVANWKELIPFLCFFPWLHGFLISQEIRVVETDDDGRFDALIFYPCHGDHPDLYFWVEVFFEGAWVTVYRPWMRCNTWWNYPCGKEVTIRLTDPRVTPCRPPVPYMGPMISVYGVGRLIAVENVTAAGMAASPITVEGTGATFAERPFTGTLGMWADFARELLAGIAVTHYLWSYRTSPAGAWTPILKPYTRRYRADFPPLTSISKNYNFEPDPHGHFAIPPDEPWLADGTPYGNWEDPWVTGIATALFETESLWPMDDPDRAGAFDLKLELFKADGTRVNLTGSGVDVQVQDLATLQPDGSYNWKLAGPVNRYFEGGQLFGFQMTVAVDNNRCSAAILDAQVGATLAGPCGFIGYPPAASVLLRFQAAHPHNHAAFLFRIARGSSGYIEQAYGKVNAASVPAINPAAGGATYNRAGITFGRSAPVGQILGPCLSAAFAEEMYCYATATDGWYSRAWWLDYYAPAKAFALTPV